MSVIYSSAHYVRIQFVNYYVCKRGCGLFLGVELVTDHNTRQPATAEAERIIFRYALRRLLHIWLLIWLILHSVAYWHLFITDHIPSVLWRCWLGGRKGTRPVKNRVLDCWHSYLSGQGADLHMAQMMPLPLTVSCFSKIQIGFTFLLLAHLGSPRKRAVKRVWVYGSWA